MSPSKKYHHSRFGIRTLPSEKSGVIISFKRSSLWPADPWPQIRTPPIIYSCWSIRNLIRIFCGTDNFWILKPFENVFFYKSRLLREFFLSKITIFDYNSVEWLRDFNSKMWIFNWLFLENIGKFLLISHNMTRIWSFNHCSLTRMHT